MNQQIQQLRQNLVDRLIKMMDEGHDWIMPWLSQRPVNAVTRRPYHGSNILYLQLAADEKGYEDPRWCTYYAAQQKGWQVRRGERSTAIEFWQLVETEIENEETGEKETVMEWKGRVHHVFNAEQIDGIPKLEEISQDFNPDYEDLANNLIESSECPVREDNQPRAFYRPSEDFIHLPLRQTFTSTASFVSTLLHEMAHSTGHPKRLGREMITKMANGEPLTEYVSALQDNGLYRYYCINRLEPGALPRKDEAEIETMNPFDERKVIETDQAERTTRCWGYIETKVPLDPDTLKRYDLIAAKGIYRAVKLDGNEIDNYPAEELVAEFASAMLEAELNVTEHHSDEQHAAYLESWGKSIKQDSNKLFNAIKAADKATDFILEAYNKLIEKKEEEKKAAAAKEEPEEKAPDLTKGPVVTIQFTEHPELSKREGEKLSLKEASLLLKELDEQEKDHPGYYKTGFRIDYLMGEAGAYEGRYDVGSEGISLLEHIRTYNTNLFESPMFRASAVKEVGEENADQYISDQKKSFEEFCRFMTYHYNLESIQDEAEKGLKTIEELIKQGRPEMELQDRIEYYHALLDFVEESRAALAKNEELPEQPKKEEYIKPQKDAAEELGEKIQILVENVMHQKTDSELYTSLLRDHDVDTIIITLQKAQRFATGEQKNNLSEMIGEVQKHINVDYSYSRPNENIREFAAKLYVDLPEKELLKEIYENLLKDKDEMKPTEIKELDKMKKARDLWAANVQSGKISVTNVIAEGIISEQGREEQLKDAIKTMRQLGKYREAKDLQIGRDYGVFNPAKMMDSYSENSADKKTLERELLFDSLANATPEEAMEEIYATRSVEPYMIPHLHILVKEHPDMKFDRFNELCDLKDPSKAYDEAGKKKTKGAWLKKISEKAGKTQENDLQNNR